MYRFKILSVILGLSVIGVILLIGMDSASDKNVINPDTYNESGERELKSIVAKQIQKNAANDSQPKNSDQSSSLFVNPENQDGRVEDEWCFAVTELADDQIVRYLELKSEWDVQRGDISMTNPFVDAVNSGTSSIPAIAFLTSNGNNEHLLAPYREMSLRELRASANSNDRYALLAIVDNPSINPTEKVEAARKLLHFGDTASSLRTLTTMELLYASFDYEEKGAMTMDIQEKILNALTYIHYGLSRKDTSALLAYLQLVRDNPIFNKELAPNVVLSENALSKIDQNVKQLVAAIDESNIRNNMMPISDIEIPKVAQHSFEASIVVLFNEYADVFEKNQVAGIWMSSYINENSCIERQYFEYASN
ncbi:hypothetical protein PN836_014355 [Ningiella sp. W23]|uniref:hypothetical protein n=1 Tax=Ningiella sp. W23 TaxID=3023715 RepID=UPI003757CA4C